MRWTASGIPDQSGRTIMVTGANSGIGLEAAKALAVAGARLVLACRDPSKADAAVSEVRGAAPSAAAPRGPPLRRHRPACPRQGPHA